jgi:ATP-dependent Clp protease ATP-binding subunit ClpA/ATP-dependent Clp protease ATP-binding subunit ClpC
VNVTLHVYQRDYRQLVRWTTIGLGPHTTVRQARSSAKVEEAMVERLKGLVGEMTPAQLELLQPRRGLSLTRVRLEMVLYGETGRRRHTGLFPLILEPRSAGPGRSLTVAYHPERQLEWFPVAADRASLEAQVGTYFAERWADLPDEELVELQWRGRERLRLLSFAATPRTLLDQLPDRKAGVWDDLSADPLRRSGRPRPRAPKVLREIGVDETVSAARGSLPCGTPRSPYREELQRLLGGTRVSSVVVLGPSGVGKTTILNQWVADQLDADGYRSHHNLDRVRHVWSVSGTRIIAGMSYLGEWEQRCTDLLHEAAGARIALRINDLHAFGRIGRSRGSDRNLAEFFRASVAAGDLLVIGECTPEEWQRLEDDSPAFAALFAPLRVASAAPGETLRIMLHEARRLEAGHRVRIHPLTYRSILELGGALFPATALPGRALDVLRELARRGAPAPSEAEEERDEEPPWSDLDGSDVLELLAEKTGLPRALLQPDVPLDPQDVEDDLGSRVQGQPEAVRAAADLILRIRAGLTDPRRPFGVYLLAGPSGTGKTELAKAIASVLYGGSARLLRLDMGEFSGGDAVSRLIGDLWEPEGLLTQRVREQPFCVVLFDEIEKAHPAVFPLLLQLLDDGRLTDASGHTADFTRAVIVMTTNLGASSQAALGFAEARAEADAGLRRALEEFFAPELRNRIDRVVRFAPLSETAAKGIARKELGALLARWGLVERNVFVSCGDAALRHIVAAGFDPTYGARTVKRYLEQEVGTLLADEIVQGTRASMRVLHLYPRDGSLGLHAQALTEAEGATAPHAVAALLDESPRELRERLPEALAILDQLLSDESLATLSTAISQHLAALNRGEPGHADAIYHMDALRGQLRRLRGRIGYHVGRPGAERWELLETLAEAQFFRRALQKIQEPQQHGVLVTLARLGLGRRPEASGTGEGLLEAMALALSRSRGQLEGFAAAVDGGRPLVHEPAELSDLEEALRERPAVLVLKLSGVCLLDYLAAETGCHLWRSLAFGTEIVRAEVASAHPDHSARSALEERAAAVRDFASALDSGSVPLPQDPDGLLPAVREIRFDPPAAGQRSPLEVQDFVLGHAETVAAASIAEVLPRLWTLRMLSVTDTEEAPC